MTPYAIVVRETPIEGATRRVVYEPRSDGHYERREQLWREAIAGWHTTGTEVVSDIAVERPEEA